MTQASLETCASQWARVGVLFNVVPAGTTPDLERLLIDTAKVADRDPRLFGMAATWLSRYSHFVAKHRLARMVAEDLEPTGQARMGLMIDFARRFARVLLMPSVLRPCRPLTPPQPLFEVDQSNPVFAKLVADHACETSRKWGLWTEEIDPGYDALRPVGWIPAHNPIFRVRARYQSDLRLSVLMCLKYEPVASASEADLTRRCGVTRRAMHKALDILWQSGDIRRSHLKRGYRIQRAPSKTVGV
jgi:hypothetical protein